MRNLPLSRRKTKIISLRNSDFQGQQQKTLMREPDAPCVGGRCLGLDAIQKCRFQTAVLKKDTGNNIQDGTATYSVRWRSLLLYSSLAISTTRSLPMIVSTPTYTTTGAAEETFASRPVSKHKGCVCARVRPRESSLWPGRQSAAIGRFLITSKYRIPADSVFMWHVARGTVDFPAILREHLHLGDLYKILIVVFD